MIRLRKGEEFLVIGMVPMAHGIPSFATPIFRRVSETNVADYIQSSKDQKKIDKFVQLPTTARTASNFILAQQNAPIKIAEDFLYGFVNINGISHVYQRLSLEQELQRQFENYSDYPFLQWTMIRTLRKPSWITRLSSAGMFSLTDAFFGAPREQSDAKNPKISYSTHFLSEFIFKQPQSEYIKKAAVNELMKPSKIREKIDVLTRQYLAHYNDTKVSPEVVKFDIIKSFTSFDKNNKHLQEFVATESAKLVMQTLLQRAYRQRSSTQPLV